MIACLNSVLLSKIRNIECSFGIINNIILYLFYNPLYYYPNSQIEFNKNVFT